MQISLLNINFSLKALHGHANHIYSTQYFNSQFVILVKIHRDIQPFLHESNVAE